MTLSLSNILIVGAGSCFGGMTRYIVSRIIQTSASGSFPWGTFAVNITGCLIIGAIYGLLDRGFQLSEGMKLFLTAGFCGGFTTFSTFMHENYLLFECGTPVIFLIYAIASFSVGLAAVYLGYSLANTF
ncbi:MAG: fluoride efflux transporter CrcB [Duncaniella sp.]|nr:fluoride efflux transporter CrcB [Duncaniella sp.]